MARLSLEQISRENKNSEVLSFTSLQLTHRALSDVSRLLLPLIIRPSSVDWFLACEGLLFEQIPLPGEIRSQLQLPHISRGSAAALSCDIFSMSLCACVNLKWLSVLENKLVTLKGIEGLSKLTVLNAGRNRLNTTDDICTLTNLRALILNDNNISSIPKLDQMKYLNSLVLSRNPIYDIGRSLMKVTSITKALSNDLAKNVKLQTLDVGNNLIENFSDVKVNKLVPHLRIFNAKPVSSVNRLEKIPAKEVVRLSKVDPDRNEKESKKRKSNPDDASGRKTSKTSIKEIDADDNPFGKVIEVCTEKKMRGNSRSGAKEPKMTVSMISTDEKEMKNKLSDYQMRNVVSLETITKKASKKPKRDPEIGGVAKSMEIDDADAPFVDLILSRKNIEEPPENKRARETIEDAKLLGGFVVDHTKWMKKSRSKNTDNCISASQLLSSRPEIGMGGPSSWDA
ncbi:Leucine-rich repeat-containing protein ODA7 [Apostasia shenzhenica]|uniref:Leucine-rich repeat-containing protein ODA7 n=1 Tax=Apostasia shenzhenica TaxID=1088818 RepID=A0A2H9ZW83_9ASPA|nr:Leucine-rich repeat-containing protein ODA7 [Apostasia shenzhenica]